MTTIVIDCERKQVAADGQRTHYIADGDGGIIPQTYHYNHSVQKIHRVGDIVIVGTGDAEAIESEVLFYKTHGRLPKQPRGIREIAVVQRKGDVVQVDIHKSQSIRTFWGRKKVTATTTIHLSSKKYITLGSGSDYAFAGMQAGMTAEEAVILASKCDPYTNNNVTVVDL